jgi:hypothetical protein
MNQNLTKLKNVVEKIHGAEFSGPVRPAWLINPVTQKPMELDLFSPDLARAYVYRGQQHYEYTPMFHSSPEDFAAMVERDHVKMELCQQHGVDLVVVPYDSELLKF